MDINILTSISIIRFIIRLRAKLPVYIQPKKVTGTIRIELDKVEFFFRPDLDWVEFGFNV